ncbi:hypothetical protein AAE478_000515 [Parahypoxylon ruwenzoriense]
MGSASNDSSQYELPVATAPSLVLAHPTEAEKRRTWTLNHAEWGGALNLDEYLQREPYLTTVPLTCDGGMTHWILTDSAFAADGKEKGEEGEGRQRPVLASCESIRKRVIVAAPGDATTHDGASFGVGSVFTYPEYRGNRYAGRMLTELGPALRTWQREDRDGRDAVCSALWSDIGKVFYAKMGWATYPSLHAEFVVPKMTTAEEEQEKNKEKRGVEVTPITYDNLAPLCGRDEELLRKQVLRTARETGRTSVAFAPDHDVMRWHLYREGFITTLLFKKSPSPNSPTAPPSIKGALAETREESGRRHRVWAIWTRNYHGSSGGASNPADNADKNTLYILRLVIDNGDEPGAGEAGKAEEEVNPHLLAAFTAVLRAAQREAAAWHVGKMDMWNPSATVRSLIKRSGLPHRWVDRDTDSIPSMMWYGDAAGTDVEWVANEKYCWC